MMEENDVPYLYFEKDSLRSKILLLVNVHWKKLSFLFLYMIGHPFMICDTKGKNWKKINRYLKITVLGPKNQQLGFKNPRTGVGFKKSFFYT